MPSRYSNFGVKHLTDLLATNPKYVPSINQVVSCDPSSQIALLF